MEAVAENSQITCTTNCTHMHSHIVKLANQLRGQVGVIGYMSIYFLVGWGSNLCRELLKSIGNANGNMNFDRKKYNVGTEFMILWANSLRIVIWIQWPTSVLRCNLTEKEKLAVQIIVPKEIFHTINAQKLYYSSKRNLPYNKCPKTVLLRTLPYINLLTRTKIFSYVLIIQQLMPSAERSKLL